MRHSRIHPALSQALDARGYDALTPVQPAVLEPDARGRDLVVSAQTGSGKTSPSGWPSPTELIEADRLPARARRSAWSSRPPASSRIQVSRELALALRRGRRPDGDLRRRHGPVEERRALGAAPSSSSARPAGFATISSAARSISRPSSRRPRRGRRDARHGLSRGARGDSRRDPARAPHPALLRDHAPADRRARQALPAQTRCASRRSARIAAHGDIVYQALAVPPSEIEHAVVNLLRFHEAETAIAVLRHPRRVRHLHASLIERGFVAVALSGEHSQTERNQRSRRCAIAAPGSASPPTSPPAASIFRSVSLHPRRVAARRRGPAAPLRAHRPRRQEGHRRPHRPLPRRTPGRNDASRRPDRRRMDLASLRGRYPRQDRQASSRR